MGSCKVLHNLSISLNVTTFKLCNFFEYIYTYTYLCTLQYLKPKCDNNLTEKLANVLFFMVCNALKLSIFFCQIVAGNKKLIKNF